MHSDNEAESVEGDQKQDDPNAALMQSALSMAAQIFCARAGETVGNRFYDHADAVADTALIMTLTLNSSSLEAALAKAAVSLGLPTVWSAAKPAAPE